MCFLQCSFAGCAQLRQLTLSDEGWAGQLEPHWQPPALLKLDLVGTSFDAPLVCDALPAALRKIVLSMYYK